jgi:hypothetical protein
MINSEIEMKVKIALVGVRRSGWTRPMKDGSRPSRPALNSRAVEVLVKSWHARVSFDTPNQHLPCRLSALVERGRAWIGSPDGCGSPVVIHIELGVR